jgi:phenylacetate-CoA ligase
VSYEPNQRFAEVVDGHLVFTIGGALPLVRYRILDLGRLLSSSDRELEALFPQSSEGDVEPHMLALYGRTDIAASYYAINVYPDHIKAGLEPFVQLGELTGKFVARVEHDESHTQSLIIQAELGPGPTDSDVATEAVAISVTDSLVALGAEFRELISHLGPTAAPRIELAPNGAEQFRIHIKQRWVL